MKYYATLLNINVAKEFSLDTKDIFDSNLQWSILGKMLCGFGKTEDESLENMIDNLLDEDVIELCACSAGAQSIITKLPSKEALRHLWIHDDELDDEPKLYQMPLHDNFVDFCERYSLPEEAQRELELFFDSVMHTAPQPHATK